jgi:hypothetical protein
MTHLREFAAASTTAEASGAARAIRVSREFTTKDFMTTGNGQCCAQTDRRTRYDTALAHMSPCTG